MTRIVTALVLLAGSWTAAATPAADGRFRTVAVYVDTGAATLGAYQVEITTGDTQPTATIVGVEGGAPAAFRAAPYYDPAALQGGRIVLAAFTTGLKAARGRIRVATLHFFEPSGCEPAYHARLAVAVAADGTDVDATVTLDPGDAAV